MTSYYNEIDPFAAQWLRNLIEAGQIAPGYVDERSIEDVYPSDLRGFTQCHFFAGIGVWSHALRSAGWSDDRPVWTGSCPCQPFSEAGAGAGFDDERHLWPHFHHIIQECRPAIVLGEQVASKDAAPWLDLVAADLEALDFAFGALAFPSSSVGAPHIRDRSYWVANSRSIGRQRRPHSEGRAGESSAEWREGDADAECRSVLGGVDHTGQHDDAGEVPPTGGGQPQADRPADQFGGPGFSPGPGPGPTNGYWRDADWLFCRDGRWRPVEPGSFPLAHGAPARVGRLRAYGNAINAKAAQAFIECVMEANDA